MMMSSSSRLGEAQRGKNFGNYARKWTVIEILEWLNTLLQLSGGGHDTSSTALNNLKETSGGGHFCAVIDAMLPGQVNMRHVVWGKRHDILDIEVSTNFRVLENVVHKNNMNFPIDHNDMVAGKPAAILDVWNCIKNTGSAPEYVARLRDYKAIDRRKLCRPSKLSKLKGNASLGRSVGKQELPAGVDGVGGPTSSNINSSTSRKTNNTMTRRKSSTNGDKSKTIMMKSATTNKSSHPMTSSTGKPKRDNNAISQSVNQSVSQTGNGSPQSSSKAVDKSLRTSSSPLRVRKGAATKRPLQGQRPHTPGKGHMLNSSDDDADDDDDGAGVRSSNGGGDNSTGGIGMSMSPSRKRPLTHWSATDNNITSDALDGGGRSDGGGGGRSKGGLEYAGDDMDGLALQLQHIQDDYENGQGQLQLNAQTVTEGGGKDGRGKTNVGRDAGVRKSGGDFGNVEREELREATPATATAIFTLLAASSIGVGGKSPKRPISQLKRSNSRSPKRPLQATLRATAAPGSGGGGGGGGGNSSIPARVAAGVKPAAHRPKLGAPRSQPPPSSLVKPAAKWPLGTKSSAAAAEFSESNPPLKQAVRPKSSSRSPSSKSPRTFGASGRDLLDSTTSHSKGGGGGGEGSGSGGGGGGGGGGVSYNSTHNSSNTGKLDDSNPGRSDDDGGAAITRSPPPLIKVRPIMPADVGTKADHDIFGHHPKIPKDSVLYKEICSLGVQQAYEIIIAASRATLAVAAANKKASDNKGRGETAAAARGRAVKPEYNNGGEGGGGPAAAAATKSRIMRLSNGSRTGGRGDGKAGPAIRIQHMQRYEYHREHLVALDNGEQRGNVRTLPRGQYNVSSSKNLPMSGKLARGDPSTPTSALTSSPPPRSTRGGGALTPKGEGVSNSSHHLSTRTGRAAEDDDDDRGGGDGGGKDVIAVTSAKEEGGGGGGDVSRDIKLERAVLQGLHQLDTSLSALTTAGNKVPAGAG